MTMNLYAFIDADNRALNFVESDGMPEYVPEGCAVVQLPTEHPYGYGWVWDGTKFEAPAAPPAAVVPESITRRQCAMMMFSQQMITGPEAIAMTQTGTPPASVQAYLDTLAEPERTFATMDFAAANYFRSNALLLALMTANNMTEQQVDEFFIAAAAL